MLPFMNQGVVYSRSAPLLSELAHQPEVVALKRTKVGFSHFLCVDAAVFFAPNLLPESPRQPLITRAILMVLPVSNLQHL